MNTKLYVGNLPFDVTELQLREHFSSQGPVAEVNVVMDRDTGRPRGFAFVEMEDASAMESAVRELDGTDFNGRPMRVNEAKPRENRSFGGGGGDNRRDQNRNGGSRKGNRGRW